MAIITLRSVKGSPLSIAEADANIANLNTEISSKLDIGSYTATDVLAKLLTVDGTNSGLDADRVQGKNIASTNTNNTLVLRDSSGNFAATTVTANLVGNVTGNIVGNGTGNWTGPATNISGVLQVDHGGTGATTSEGARTALGIGTIASQNSNNVDITGGSITGCTIAVADGGTGANTANAARVNLGLNVGSDIQGFAPILSSISSISADGFIVKNGTGLAVSRVLVAGTNINISNADGISGNPTLSLVSSPALTGTPTAPTAIAGTNTTQIATTAFTTSAVSTSATTQQTYTDTKFNSLTGISKAWVIFDGNTGSIIKSSNVTSVSSNGSGQYTVNITSGVFSDGSYIMFGTCSTSSQTGGHWISHINSTATSCVVYALAPNYTATTASTNNGIIRIALFN